jgi:hypothetical protein
MHTCAGNHFKVLVAPPALAWLKVMQEMQEEQPFASQRISSRLQTDSALGCVWHMCALHY